MWEPSGESEERPGDPGTLVSRVRSLGFSSA